MSLEDRRDLFAIAIRDPGCGSEFLEEPVPSAGDEHDDQLGRLIGQVQERVRQAGWEVGEAARLECVQLIADPDLEPAADDVSVSSCS